MELDSVPPILSTHNAYLNVCAARCRSLVELPPHRRNDMRRLAVDTDPATPLRLAEQRMLRIEEEGFAPDGYAFLGLLRACAAACDVPRAQRVISRMLDSGVPPSHLHFHELLHGCSRVQIWGPQSEAGEALRVALSVPGSMEQLELGVTQETCDRVLHTHAAGRHVAASLELLHALYARHGTAPGPRAFGHLLRLSSQIRHPELARQLLQQMEAMGVPIADAQYEIPETIEHQLAEHAAHRRRWAVAPPSEFQALPRGGRRAVRPGAGSSLLLS